MNKTLINTAILAATASLAMSGQAWAHHPSEDMNPNFEFVDEQVSDMHIEIIDAMLEDGDLMSSTARGMDAVDSPAMASGDGANASQDSTQSASQVLVAPGPGSSTAARGGSR